MKNKVRQFNDKIGKEKRWYTSNDEEIVKAFMLNKHKEVIVLKVKKEGIYIYYTLNAEKFERFYKFYVLG